MTGSVNLPIGTGTTTGLPWSSRAVPGFPALTQVEADINAATVSGIDPQDFLANMYPVYNVMDPAYGATGDGTTNDTAAVQSAINACEAVGGGIVFFPPGAYLCDPLTVNKPIRLIGVSRGGDVSEDGNSVALSHILASGTTEALDVITFASATAANELTGCGMENMGIIATGVNPRYGLRLRGIHHSRFVNLKFDDFGATSTACILLEARTTAGSGSNGCFWNTFDMINMGLGGTCDGIYMDGESNSKTCTQNYFRGINITHGNGNAIVLDGDVDNNRFHDMHLIRATAATGLGVLLIDGMVATIAHPRMNTFTSLNGHVESGPNSRGNTFAFATNETSSLSFMSTAAPIHYTCVDRTHRDMFTTHRYPITDQIWIGAEQCALVSTSARGSHGGAPSIDLSNTDGEGLSVLVPGVHDWSDGTLTNVRVYYGSSTNSVSYHLNTDIGTYAIATAINTGEYTTDFTGITTVGAAANVVSTADIPCALVFVRDDMIKINLNRDATSDAEASTVSILGLMLLFESDGAVGLGAEGPWAVPTEYDT